MQGFRRIYGINWLKDEEKTVLIYANNKVKRLADCRGCLPEHWVRVKDLLFSSQKSDRKGGQ